MSNIKRYLIIDCHNHLYPTSDAGRGMKREGEILTAPGYGTRSYGLIEDAVANMERANIRKTFILPMMPVGAMRHKRLSALPADLPAEKRKQAEKDIDGLLIERIQRLNRWACSVAQEDERFVAFFIVDPIMGPDLMRQEIRDLVKQQGAMGLGELVPDQMGRMLQGLCANDSSLWPMWETAVELGIPALCHFGPSHPHPITGGAVYQNNPEYWFDVADRFPRLKLIELHMNITLNTRWPELYRASRQVGISFAKEHPEVICDVSGNLGYGTPVEDLVEVIREVGVERVIWGSDFMWVDPLKEIEALLDSSLTEREKRLVLGENAARIFNLAV